MTQSSSEGPGPDELVPPVEEEGEDWLADLTPRKIVEELDRYIVGQGQAKKAVAIALRNRWRRQRVEEDLRDEIQPNNLILIGPTGVGKTEIARRMARLAAAPFVKVEASKFTEVGYVGRDVESMVRDLVDTAVNMVRSEREEDVEEIAEQRAEERILDLLLPAGGATSAPSASPDSSQGRGSGTGTIEEAGPRVFVAGSGGGGVSELRAPDSGNPLSSVADSDEAAGEDSEDSLLRRRHRTREKLRELLLAGKLEDREVEVEVRQTPNLDGMMLPMGGGDGMDFNFADMLQEILPKRTKRRVVAIAEARRILVQEELDRLVDMDEVINEALERAEDTGIIFLDEIDKIAGERGAAGGPDVSREGVQRDLLPIVEGSNVTTRYGLVRTDHILFVAAGAFHVAKPSDLIPELQGRFPIRVELHSLGEDDFVRILQEPKNALVRQYAALLATEGLDLTFEESGIRELARIAAQLNDRMENIGARRLQTVLTTLLEDALFDLPEAGGDRLAVDADFVRNRISHIVADEDLRRYIL